MKTRFFISLFVCLYEHTHSLNECIKKIFFFPKPLLLIYYVFQTEILRFNGIFATHTQIIDQKINLVNKNLGGYE